MLTAAAIVTRMLVSESCGWWLGNCLFLVAKSSCFGCGIACFWLRNRLFLVSESVLFGCGIGYFLVAEAPFFGCGNVSDFGCGIAEIWLREHRNMVSESDFIRMRWEVLSACKRSRPASCKHVTLRAATSGG